MKLAFAGLVLTQAAHSTEEYIGRLWELAPTARYVSSLISSDLQSGFLIANAGVVALALACLIGLVLPARAGAGAAIWFWAVLECLNGAGHLIWAAMAGAYRPGAWTAPLLLIFGVTLLIGRARHRDPAPGP